MYPPVRTPLLTLELTHGEECGSGSTATTDPLCGSSSSTPHVDSALELAPPLAEAGRGRDRGLELSVRNVARVHDASGGMRAAAGSVPGIFGCARRRAASAAMRSALTRLSTTTRRCRARAGATWIADDVIGSFSATDINIRLPSASSSGPGIGALNLRYSVVHSFLRGKYGLLAPSSVAIFSTRCRAGSSGRDDADFGGGDQSTWSNRRAPSCSCSASRGRRGRASWTCCARRRSRSLLT